MRLICLTASLLVVSALFASAQKNDHPPLDGRITGTVIDDEGRPVAGVFVEADNFVSQPAAPEPTRSNEPSQAKDNLPKQHRKWLEEGVSWLVEIPGATTTDVGEFEIPSLGLMRFELRGGNDEYPSVPLTFTDGSPAEVTLTPEAAVAAVVVKLGQKGGVVTGSVKDKQSGMALAAGYELFRADNNSQMFVSSESSDFHFLIPSLIAVNLRVTADGYRQISVPLFFEPGEHKEVNLELEPAPSSRHWTLRVVPTSNP